VSAKPTDDIASLPDLSLDISAEPEAVAATRSAMAPVSAQDLSADILGGVDFEVPPATKNATPTFSPSFAAKPIGATEVSAAKPAALPPSPFKSTAATPGFKPAVPAFAKPGSTPGIVPPLSAPLGSPLARPAAAPVAAVETPKVEMSTAELRAALVSAEAPATVPKEAAALAFHLCRLLIKNGVVTVDDLVAALKPS
jgi:hypothetical protein